MIYTAQEIAEEVDVVLEETVENYSGTIHRLKEILRLPAGTNSEEVCGKVAGLVHRNQELEGLQIPPIVYKYDKKDFTKLFRITNKIVLIIENEGKK